MSVVGTTMGTLRVCVSAWFISKSTITFSTLVSVFQCGNDLSITEPKVYFLNLEEMT